MATNHIQILVSGARQDKYAQLQKLAEKLGGRITDLAWLGIDHVLKNPPASLPQAFAPRAGSARGFWVVNTLDEATGRLKGVSVIEVAKRGDANGATFIRYSAGDAKGRQRAYNQAQKISAYNATLAGLKVPATGIPTKELPDKEGKAVEKKEKKDGAKE